VETTTPKRKKRMTTTVINNLQKNQTNQEYDILLNGCDPEENIVATSVIDGVAYVYKRNKETDTVTSYEDEFHPFIWIKKEKCHISPKYERHIQRIDLKGKGVYNQIINFDSHIDMYTFLKNYVPPTKMSAPDLVPEDYSDYKAKKDSNDQYLIQTGKTLFKGMNYNDLKIMAFDIETTRIVRDYEGNITCDIKMISVVDNRGFKTVIYEPTEAEMIKKFFALIRKNDWDVLLSYNGYLFDWLVIYQKAQALGIPTTIGRHNLEMKVLPTTIRMGDNKQAKLDIFIVPGRQNIDLYYSVRKYDTTLRSMDASYNLKSVISELELEREGRVFVPGDMIQETLEKDPEKVKEYCLDDSIDTLNLGEFLLSTDFVATQLLPMSFEKEVLAGNSTKIESLFLRAYYLYEHSIPQSALKTDSVPGGYVDCKRKGTDKNIVHIDVSSLYPSIIVKDLIKPLTDELDIFVPIIKTMKVKRLFGKQEEKNFAEKNDCKEEKKWFGFQNAFKVFINAMYGVLASMYFPWNDIKEATKITEEGQRLIKIMISVSENCGFALKNADTDGIYITLLDINKWNEKIGQKYGIFEPEYDKETKIMLNYKEFVEKTKNFINDSLPEGIEIDTKFYESMCSICPKTYVLRELSGKTILKGVSLKSKGMEKFGQEFISKSIQLIMDDKKDQIKFLYRKLREDIIGHKLPIEYFQQSKEVKKTPEQYLREKKTTQAHYELMLKTGRSVERGTRAYYYLAQGEIPKFSEDYDTNKPDEDINYLLSKLEGFTRRLFNPEKPFDSVLTENDYVNIFADEMPQMTLNFDSYDCADFYNPSYEGGKWNRKKILEHEIDFISKNPIDSYRTIQKFRNNNQIDEKHISDLYFDIDSEITPEIKEKVKTAKTIEEKLLILETVITSGLEDVYKITNYFISKMGFTKNDFEIYFSGFKGFHLIIPHEKFGITTGRNDLTYIYKLIAMKLDEDLDLQNIDIGSIYSKRRMIRLPFTINSKSGLMKIPLTLDAINNHFSKKEGSIHILQAICATEFYIQKNNCSIKELYDSKDKIKPDRSINLIAETWFKNIVKEYEDNDTIEACSKPKYKFVRLKDYPICIKEILRSGIRHNGDRNKATIVMATFFKNLGKSEKETTEIITKWALELPNNMTTSSNTQIVNSTKTAVKTIYSSDRYYFSCASVKSLGSKESKIPCLKSCVLND
jgi:DNA polymerase elongation subunit (family B)